MWYCFRSLLLAVRLTIATFILSETASFCWVMFGPTHWVAAVQGTCLRANGDRKVCRQLQLQVYCGIHKTFSMSAPEV